MDGEGRIAAANERLLALEKNPAQPALARELEEWLNDYTSPLPAPQRRFLMRELQRLAPGVDFPTLAAEDLAARYLEATPPPTPTGALRASALPGVWEAGSPDGRTLALFETDSIRQKIVALDLRQRSDKLLRLTVAAPGEDAVRDLKAAAVTLAPEFPGWKLALEPIDRSFFTAASQKRVATHLWIGSIVIAAMSVLALFVARGLGRQVQLARLKNDLVATFSHELKTPLTAMRALVDTLLDAEKFDDKTTREYLQLVAAENSRLSRLIDHFLTFSRLERNKFPFSFSRLQPQSVVEAALAAMGERRSHVTVTASPTLPEIVGDRDALVTALLNLLDNAWKYSRDDKRIALRTDAQNGRVRFAVEDHGIGITAYERRRVFDHFYRGDQRLTRTVGGCGLGLSIVRSIVAAHGGTVEVVSEVGRGSTFTIEIPAAS
jgi:signal transduction histidine kinase